MRRKIEGAEKLTTFIKPMLAQLTDRPAFDSPDWVFEIKWDGFRAVAEVNKKENRLYSRNGLSFAKAYTKVFDALKHLKKECVLDGEIVVFDESGKPSFQMLQNYSNRSGHAIHYYVFDCLSINGEDLTKLSLLERKKRVQKILPTNDSVIRYCDHIEEHGKDLFRQIEKMGLEGMIAKRASSTYHAGKRNTDWLKIKNVKSEEAIIVGYSAPKGSREGFGSLLLAQYSRKKLLYIGNVGTGFTNQILKDLHKKLKAITRPETPLDTPVKVPSGTQWVDPVYVCNIKYTEKTTDGIVRHPVYLGLRIDKEAKDVHPEKSKKIRL